MFRKYSGGIGISFTQFVNSAMPSVTFDITRNPGHFSLTQKDTFYGHQLMSSNPYKFDELSLLHSGILDNETTSRRGFKKLQKAEVLDAEGYVDTTKIGPKFTSATAVISASRQNQIIDLLFWWEEECHRLRRLQAEKAEFEGLVESARCDLVRHRDEDWRHAHFEMMILLLDRVKLKIRQRPSERTKALEKNKDELIMKYKAEIVAAVVIPTVPMIDEALPDYFSAHVQNC